MMRLWLALLVGLASPLLAEPVRVTSGEHGGFTRLVFDYGRPVDWQFGRSADGYELHVPASATTYDLTGVFNLIGTSRLAAIWAAPDSGNLHIGLACACHAIPFEFRPGIVVVDLRDGPPPKGSSFETALDGGTSSPIAALAPLRPRRRPGAYEPTGPQAQEVTGSYDWKVAAYSALRGQDVRPRVPPARSDVTGALLPPDPGLQPLRDQILHQMARGAAQGVVDMAQPEGQRIDLPETDFPLAQIRIGEAPTSVNRQDRAVTGDLGAQGAKCIAPDALQVVSWGDETLPMVDQMAISRGSLSGEFDKPDPDAVARAIRIHLFLGFGAEARQMILAFGVASEETPVWRALSRLIDGQPDPEGVFRGQAACAGPAALWSVLDDDTLTKGDAIDSQAIRLAFADLPLHLRRLIGPPLAERLLALGDAEAARALGDAITRAPGDPGAPVSLMKAKLDLHAGNLAEAEKIAVEVMNDPGPGQPEALIALTEARISQHLPMTPKVALALQSHLADHKGTELEPRLQEALILAEAASGNFYAAFAGLQRHPSREADVWALAANLAPDDVFLSFAVLDPAANVPEVPDETAALIARRLVDLGLGPAAQLWLTTVNEPDPLLIAQAALGQADGRAALIPLAGVEGEIPTALKLQAFALLGEDRMSVDVLLGLGDLPAASAALARAGDWERLATTGEGPWHTLATRLSETPAPVDTLSTLPYGPLARGHDLALAGSETRSAIEVLLATVPPPLTGAPGLAEP